MLFELRRIRVDASKRRLGSGSPRLPAPDSVSKVGRPEWSSARHRSLTSRFARLQERP
jgi:hypothetical protein